VVRTVSASLILADVALEEAARTLGANRWRTFVRVTLPQIAPGVVAGALFAFMVSFDNFPVSMWLADAANDPMPMLIFRRVASTFDPSVAAMSTLMVGLAIVVVLAIERLVGLKRAMGV
jgi:putative spermidine/putrescine transport system permease protein